MQALQVSMQGPLEELILKDRLTFLREAGLKDCTLTPVFKTQISPRNLAIIVNYV